MENTKIESTEIKHYRRAGFMDEVRGFCIICMVVYHVLFDLNYSYGIHIPIMFDSWFDIIRDIFAGAFMFISGMSSRYSRNNAKRGIQCFFIGMVITFIFAFFAPDAPILFGILHFMGISMMMDGVWEGIFKKVPAPVGIAVCAVLFLLTRGIMYGWLGPCEGVGIKLPDFLYQAKLLFPLGFRSPDFQSMDYFPLLPWFFVFLAGTYLGEYAVNDKMPAFFYKTHIKALAFIGKYTLWIYVLHQPIAMGIFLLIFGR